MGEIDELLADENEGGGVLAGAEVKTGRMSVAEPQLSHVPKSDSVNHPAHYNAHPAGVECIDVVEHYNFNVGNAIKYLWRAGLKGDEIEDLRKAAWYVNREIARREADG